MTSKVSLTPQYSDVKVTFTGYIWCDVAMVLINQKKYQSQNFAWGVQNLACLGNPPSECLSTTEPEDKRRCTSMTAGSRQQMFKNVKWLESL